MDGCPLKTLLHLYALPLQLARIQLQHFVQQETDVDQRCRGSFPDETPSLVRTMRDSGHLSLRHLEMLRRMLRIVSRQVNEIGDRFQWIIDFMRDRCRQSSGSSQFLTSPQSLFGSFLCSNVSGNCRCANDLAASSAP